MPKIKDITNQRFGRLIVIKQAHKVGPHGAKPDRMLTPDEEIRIWGLWKMLR